MTEWLTLVLLLDKFLNISSVAQSCLTLCNPMECSMPGFPVHQQLQELAQTLVHWVSDAIQPSHPVVPFSSCLQSFQLSVSYPMSWHFASDGHSIGASASASVFPVNIPWGLTGLISLQSKGLSRVFFSTTIQKHQFFFMIQLSNLYMTTGKNHSFD